MNILVGLGHEPKRMAFSPDGRYLVVCGSKAFHVWDVFGQAEPLWTIEDDLWFGQNLCFAPDGKSLVGGYLTNYRRYDTLTGYTENESSSLSAFRPDFFSPDGRMAFTIERRLKTCQLRSLHATDGGNWKEGWSKQIRYGAEQAIALNMPLVSADGQQFALVFEREQDTQGLLVSGIQVFETQSGQNASQWEGALPAVELKGAACRTTVVLLSARALYAIDTTVPDSDPVKRLNASQKHFTAAAFAPDGSRLATTSNDTAATIWDAATWEVRKRYEWNIGRLRTVCFAPDGLRCAAASDTGQIVVWDLDD